MHLVILVITQEDRKHEEACNTCNQAHADGPPQMMCSALHAHDARRIIECREEVELPDGDCGK